MLIQELHNTDQRGIHWPEDRWLFERHDAQV